MTPEAQRMYDEMTEVSELFLSDTNAYKAKAIRMSVKADSLKQVIGEIIDENMIDKIFNSSYTDTFLLETVANFLELDIADIKTSSNIDDTVEFAQKIMIHETLADIFNVARHTCDLSRNDFCFCWLILNATGKLGSFLIDAKSVHHKIKPSIFEALNMANKNKEIAMMFDDAFALERKNGESN